MSDAIRKQIQEMVDLETEGWNTKNPDLFLSIIHPDMAWPWPPTADAHDPVDWVFVMGRFDRDRWRKIWQDIFDSHDLIRNQRYTVKIELSNEQDAAFAVVDIDTQWRQDLAALSHCPNVRVEIGAIECLFGRDWNREQVAPWILSLIELFGPARCMFGSHMPIAGLSSGFERLYDEYQEIVAKFSGTERDAMFRGTAAAWFGLELSRKGAKDDD